VRIGGHQAILALKVEDNSDGTDGITLLGPVEDVAGPDDGARQPAHRIACDDVLEIFRKQVVEATSLRCPRRNAR